MIYRTVKNQNIKAARGKKVIDSASRIKKIKSFPEKILKFQYNM